MRKIKLAILSIVMLVTVGCSDNALDTVGTLVNVKIVDIGESDPCMRCAMSYDITFEKNGEKVILRTSDEDLARTLSVGTTVDVDYDADYHIDKVVFRNIQSDVGRRNEEGL
jgi:hypothetical protein